MESKLQGIAAEGYMRISGIALVLFLGIGLMSCNRDDRANGEGPKARQAGRDAYRAAQEAKRDLKKAERDIESAGKEFREGWNEAKSSDKSRRDRDK